MTASLTISGRNATLTLSHMPCLFAEYTTDIFNGFLLCNQMHLRHKTLIMADGIALPNCITLRADNGDSESED